MIDFIKNLFKKELRPLSLSKKELTEIFNKQQVCPDCGVWDFREGPSGGLATNIYCANCGSWFNEQGPFGLDRIRFKDRSPQEAIFQQGAGYRFYSWKIANEWTMFELPDVEEDVLKWCCKNIDGPWSVKNDYVYIKNDTDIMAFKLRWL